MKPSSRAIEGAWRDLPPMEARSADELPVGPDWQYEPKWDGFRCMAFKAGRTVELRAKSGKGLHRYFPEVAASVAAIALKSAVLDCEILIRIDGELSFDALQMRLHPAASRILKLSRETPANLIVFDTLVDANGRTLNQHPFKDRLDELNKLASTFPEPISLTPMTRDVRLATSWLKKGYAGTDGVIAKRLELDYRFGERAMLKVKRVRTADCVVGGFRYGQKDELVGSLLLGLYDAAGLLHHVGFTSALAASEKHSLTTKLEKLIQPPGFTGDAPGGPSRWSTARTANWMPLKPKLVVEVSFDHVTACRFRHGTKLLRWRPDKAPQQCTFDQIR
jgi:ATP-dependent DNA ligase